MEYIVNFSHLSYNNDDSNNNDDDDDDVVCTQVVY